MAQLVEITPDQPKVRLESELRYWASLGPVPGPAIAAYRAGEFSDQQDTATHGFGHAPEMWFAVEIKNDSFDDQREGDPFVIVYDAMLAVGYRLFLVREDGLTENLVDYSSYRPFNPQDHAVNRLRSPEFRLAPGEQVTVLAHLQLGPIPMSSLILYRPDTLTRDGLTWASSMAAFYAFSLSSVVLGFGFLVAMRSRIGCLYTLVLIALLLQLANIDLLFFRFAFPDQPDLYRISLYAILFAIAAAICLLVSEGVRGSEGQRPALSWVMLGLAGLSLGLLALTFLVETVLATYFGLGIIAVGLAANIFIPQARFQREDNPTRGLRWILFLIFATSIFSMIWGTFGWDFGWFNTRVAFKASYAVLLVAIMTFLTSNLIVLRLRHVQAVEARVEALEAEAERSRQLLETERAYVRARETAAARQRQLATASHDIKQPLMSLRTTFDAIAADMDQSVTDRLRDAFTYLETLSKGYVDDTVPDRDDPNSAPLADLADAEAETYALSVPLNTIHQMFNGEAVSKGLRLRVVETSLQSTAPPMVLMRILTNLVSNGLKYTNQGGVLIGVRRTDPAIWVCDTGPGMTDAEIATFKDAYSKGDKSTGHGLGLSVCFELSASNNLPLSVTSVPGKGTIFKLSLAHHLPAS